MLTRSALLLGLAACVAAGPVRAADDPKAVEAQKAAAVANLNKAGLKKLATAETASLVVVTSLSEAKAKSLADAAQKVFAFSRATLKLDEKEALWPGKLTVVVVGDPREYSGYVRIVTQQRPDAKDWFSINTRGDTPTASVLLESGEKTKDAEAQATVGGIVAAALLNKKAGTNSTTGPLPEWVQLGFGKAMAARATGGTALSDYRAKAKAAALGKKGTPARLADVWSGVKSKDSDVVAASVVDYMLYGTDEDKFFAFAAAFKPSETTAMPTVQTALEAAEWKPDALEAGWRTWVAKQK